MEIKFHSTVIMTENFEQMKSFYQEILQQKVEFDFGNCVGFKNGLSLWIRIPVKPATYSGFKFTTFNPFPFSN